MRIFSIVLAIGVSISLYFLIVDRKSLVSFLNKWGNLEQVKNEENPLENKPLIPEIEEIFPHVIVKRSESIKTNNIFSTDMASKASETMRGAFDWLEKLQKGRQKIFS